MAGRFHATRECRRWVIRSGGSGNSRSHFGCTGGTIRAWRGCAQDHDPVRSVRLAWRSLVRRQSQARHRSVIRTISSVTGEVRPALKKAPPVAQKRRGFRQRSVEIGGYPIHRSQRIPSTAHFPNRNQVTKSKLPKKTPPGEAGQVECESAGNAPAVSRLSSQEKVPGGDAIKGSPAVGTAELLSVYVGKHGTRGSSMLSTAQVCKRGWKCDGRGRPSVRTSAASNVVGATQMAQSVLL